MQSYAAKSHIQQYHSSLPVGAHMKNHFYWKLSLSSGVADNIYLGMQNMPMDLNTVASAHTGHLQQGSALLQTASCSASALHMVCLTSCLDHLLIGRGELRAIVQVFVQICPYQM